MNIILRSIRSIPVHIFLLPFFFIIKKLNQYSGLIELKDAVSALLIIAAGMILVCLILYFFLKDVRKAAIITTFAGILYLFFGDLKQGLSDVSFLKMLGHYRFYLPLLVFLSGFIFYKLIKARNLLRVTLFLNLLFLIFILFEGWYMSGVNKKYAKDNQLFKEIGFSDTSHIPSKKEKPNIYFIVPDCYPSGAFQKEMLGTNNDYFDNYLKEKGFFVANDSRSNYNRTAFSIASALSMNYIKWLDTSWKVTSFDYTRVLHLIQKAPLLSILKENNYLFYNLSVFDFGSIPSIRKENFLAVTPGEVIFYNTLWHVIKRDFLLTSYPEISISSHGRKDMTALKKKYEPLKEYNQKILDSVPALAENRKSNFPFFLYAHLYMPHFPYFYNSTGSAYSTDSLYNDSLITDRKKFAGYINYTNMKLSLLLDTLFHHGADKDIIIIQSDHGIADFDFSRKKDAFRNYFAIYFPDRNYELLYDSISNVNTFRVILNKYFNYKLSLIKDSSVYLNN